MDENDIFEDDFFNDNDLIIPVQEIKHSNPTKEEKAIKKRLKPKTKIFRLSFS